MAYVKDYGYVAGPYAAVTAPVANTGAISKNDIVVKDGVAGYIKRWSAAGDEIVGVALAASDAPTLDGDYSISIALPLPGTMFRIKASGIAATDQFKTCDVDSRTTLDITKDNYSDVFIVDTDADDGSAIVMFRHPFGEITVNSAVDY
jgi:hypothetical protein